MNLKKIAGMCKSAGSFHVTNIVNDAGEVTDQWVILGPAGLSQKHTEPGSVPGNDRPHSRWA